MRSMAPIALAVSFAAVPARAQLNTYYTGMVREAGKEVPATAQFSLEPGRVAVIMKGARASRMLFLEKEQVLRFVDDTHGNYVDLGKGTRQGLASGATQQLGEMQKQLNKLPPEQRRMAQEM